MSNIGAAFITAGRIYPRRTTSCIYFHGWRDLMEMANRVGIARLLTAGTMAPAALVFLLAAAAATGLYVADLRRAGDERIEKLAEAVGTNASDAVIRGANAESATFLAAFRAEPAIVAAAIYDDRGSLLGSYVRANSPTYEVPSMPVRDALSSTSDLLLPVRIEERIVGTLYVASDLAMLRPRVARLTSIFLLSLCLLFVLSSRMRKQLHRRVIDPLAELSGVVDRVADNHDYGLRSDVASRDDEIGRLASRLNDVLGEMDERYRELCERRDHLEEDVAMRTAQVSAANALLMEAKNSAEEAARINGELSRKNQLILDSVADGIFGVDAKGSVTFINPAGAALLGWSASELIGRPLHARIHPEIDENRVSCPLCADAALTSIRARIQTRAGVLPVEFTANELRDDSGDLMGKVVTFRDVSERVAVERMKDEFVATVSHELKTPLTSIRGALGLLAAGALGRLPDRSKDMLRIALANSDRLVRLVQDILDTERLTSGRVDLKRDLVEVAPLLDEARAVMQTMADDAGVVLAVEPVLHPKRAIVDADRDRLMQTLTNLLSNAIKFSVRGGIVRLAASLRQETLEIRVMDQGRGIPPDKLGVIFERFRQVDASDAREKGGSGLGLAICRGIIEAHGGSMRVESTLGVGSIFAITLPLAGGHAADEMAVSNEALQPTY